MTLQLSHISATWPPLLSFPVIRPDPSRAPQGILKQLNRKFTLLPEDGSRALFLIVFGLLKKLLIADYLGGSLVNRVFDTPRRLQRHGES